MTVGSRKLILTTVIHIEMNPAKLVVVGSGFLQTTFQVVPQCTGGNDTAAQWIRMRYGLGWVNFYLYFWTTVRPGIKDVFSHGITGSEKIFLCSNIRLSDQENWQFSSFLYLYHTLPDLQVKSFSVFNATPCGMLEIIFRKVRIVAKAHGSQLFFIFLLTKTKNTGKNRSTLMRQRMRKRKVHQN